MNRFHKYRAMFFMIAMIVTSSSAFANFIVATPDQVMVTTEGLFMNLDGISLSVESLSVANDGYIVAIPSPKADVCPNCGHDGYVPGRFCRWCNFPDNNKVN